MLLRRGLRDVCPKKWSCQIQFCPWSTATKFSPCCLTCTSVMACFWCRPALWQSNTLIWSILSPLILAYLTLGESQLAGCFLGLPGVGVFLAIVIFPFGWTGKERAHRTCCNVTAVLPMSGHRSSANPCCGLPRAQLFLVVQTLHSSVLLWLLSVCPWFSNCFGAFSLTLLSCPSCCFYWQTVSLQTNINISATNAAKLKTQYSSEKNFKVWLTEVQV